MELEEKLSRYVLDADVVFRKLEIIVDQKVVYSKNLREVIEIAKGYFNDAKYYQTSGDHATGLASITYCGGLLDALRFLGFVRFS